MSIITNDLQKAINALKNNDVVAIPTETVYGLAGNAENEDALTKIFTLKQRPMTHPLIMHVGKDWDLSRWVAYIPEYAKTLMEHFWPGPLTLVFEAKEDKVSSLLRGGQHTVAIRCPNHPIAQTLLQALEFPLAAPSANPFGKISPTTSKHVQQSFPHENLLILEGGRASIGIESSIVAATDPKTYAVLRHGIIDESMLQALLPTCELKTNESLRVPGKLKTHYQPEKPLYVFEDREDLIAFCQSHPQSFAFFFSKETEHCPQDPAFSFYQLPNTPQELAFELYYQLRRIDQSLAKQIAMELPPKTIAWEAIRERLLKASTPIKA